MFDLMIIICAILSFILLFYTFSKKCNYTELKQKKIYEDLTTKD